MRFLSIFLIFLSFINFSNTLAQKTHEIPGITVKDLSIEVEKGIMENTNFYLINENATHFLNLNLDVNMGKYTYINQKVKSIVGDNQFRYIEYNVEFGVRPFRGIDIYIRHMSGHALDTVFPQEDFPEDNSLGIRFNLIRN